jgi:hypothetical protein
MSFMKTKSLFTLLIPALFNHLAFAQIPPSMMPPQGIQPGMQQGMPRPPEGGVMRDDPRRPVDQISRDLGVSPDQFRACFNDVKPAPKGSLPGSNQKQANKAVLLGCLQRANPSITNGSLDQVMDRYRPGGRAAQ